MGFKIEGFKPNPRHVKQRLCHCFNFDHLNREQGIAILIGVEHEDDALNLLSNFGNVPEEWRYFGIGIKLLNGDVIGGDPIIEVDEDLSGRLSDMTDHEGYEDFIESEINRFRPFVKLNSQLFQYWNSGKHPDCTPLPYFIEWALSKGFRPAWLDRAIEFGLYTPKQENITNKIAPANNAEHYSTKWLDIQQAAIAQFFNPRRNPDAKKEEVIGWINSQAVNAGLGESNNIASTIFTIIKPDNHDPKKKRIEPQQGQ